MRWTLIALCAGMSLMAACSEETEQNAERAVEGAAADAAANAEKVLEDAADAAGTAAENLSEDFDRETAEREADLQDQSVGEAQAD